MNALLAFVAVSAAPPSLQPYQDLPSQVVHSRVLEKREQGGFPGSVVLEIVREWDLGPDAVAPAPVEAGRVTLGRGERKRATLNPQFQPTLQSALNRLKAASASFSNAGASLDDLLQAKNAVDDVIERGRERVKAEVLDLNPDDHLKAPEDISVTYVLGHLEFFQGVILRINFEPDNPGLPIVPIFSTFIPVARQLVPAQEPLQIIVNKRPREAQMLPDGFGELPKEALPGAFHRHTLEPFIRPASVDRATQPEGGKPPSRWPFTEGIPQYWVPLEKTKVYGEFGDWVDKRFKDRSTPVVSGDGFTQMAFDGAPLNWTTGAGSTLAGEEAYGFPIGAVWLPSDPAYQAMVGLESFAFVPAVGISDSALMPQEQMMFRAACLEFNKKPPEPGIAYRPAFLNDTGLTMLAQKMVPVSRDVRLVQTAIWAYMDHAGPMEVLERLTGGISAAAYVRALKLIDESAGLSPAMLKDEDVLHPVLMSVYGLPEEELNWFMALYARSAPGAIAKALERPGANLQALYDKDTPESEAKDFVMNLGRLLISGGDPVKKSVVEFLHKSYPSARYELFRNDFMGYALAAAAGAEDNALADRAKSFIEKSGAPAFLP